MAGRYHRRCRRRRCRCCRSPLQDWRRRSRPSSVEYSRNFTPSAWQNFSNSRLMSRCTFIGSFEENDCADIIYPWFILKYRRNIIRLLPLRAQRVLKIIGHFKSFSIISNYVSSDVCIFKNSHILFLYCTMRHGFIYNRYIFLYTFIITRRLSHHRL